MISELRGRHLDGFDVQDCDTSKGLLPEDNRFFTIMPVPYKAATICSAFGEHKKSHYETAINFLLQTPILRLSESLIARQVKSKNHSCMCFLNIHRIVDKKIGFDG
jgi:hypothetical protein